jgi:uncharacterized MAPEG superfamily protein
MTTDLWCVVAIAVWSVLLAYIGVLGRVRKVGTKWGFGNRHEVLPEMPHWVQRGDRAYANHLANAGVFVALALVAHVSGEHDDVTATASVVFVVARVAHSLLYVAGVAYLRTLVFWASLGALGTIISRLL